MNLLIEQIEIYKSPIKLKEPFVISLGRLEYAENIIVIIKTNNGIKGFGECSPFMTINGESMDTCYVVANYLGKMLLGKDPLNIKKCSEMMDNVIYGNSSIKSAFDIALYDIASQHAKLPLYEFLGGYNNKPLVTDYTVSLGDIPKMIFDAETIIDKGFQVLKVKLGESKDKDLERIRKIREAIGLKIPIRIDANQGWQIDEAKQILFDLAPFNIQFCEEPIARWNFMALPQLKAESPIPIMADESCCDHHDAKRLIDLNACDYFNIKLGKAFGIYKALKIIKLAEKASIKIQIGGFLESRLGFTAAAHLSFVSDCIKFYDFDTPLMFVDDPIIGGISYNENGVVNVSNLPGLGLSVNDAYLESLEKTTLC